MLLCIVSLNWFTFRVSQAVELVICRTSRMKSVRIMTNVSAICNLASYSMLCFHLTPLPVTAEKGWYNDFHCVHEHFLFVCFVRSFCQPLISQCRHFVNLKWKCGICSYFVFISFSPSAKRIICKVFKLSSFKWLFLVIRRHSVWIVGGALAILLQEKLSVPNREGKNRGFKIITSKMEVLKVYNNRNSSQIKIWDVLKKKQILLFGICSKLWWWMLWQY